MSLEQVRMSQDADQARRLQALLAFQGTVHLSDHGGAGHRVKRQRVVAFGLYRQGEHDGIKPDMAVITATASWGKCCMYIAPRRWCC